MERVLLASVFPRPAFGPNCPLSGSGLGLPLTKAIPWQSWGGNSPRHPARGLPRVLAIDAPRAEGPAVALTILGVSALFTSGILEGQVLGHWRLTFADGRTEEHSLRLGSHAVEATNLEPRSLVTEDGVKVRTVGVMDVGGEAVRLDLFDIPLHRPGHLRSLAFHVEESGASFLWCDVFVAVEQPIVCPFRGQGGRVSIEEVATIVRQRDPVRLERALEQFSQGVLRSSNLDEAKGLSLLFLGAISAALLETGAPRSLHLIQLQAARELDQQSSKEEVSASAMKWIRGVLDGLLEPLNRTPDPIQQATRIINENLAEEIDDSELAQRVGLSTSHFRAKFRAQMGQPVARYIMTMRLERANEMLKAGGIPVHCVASAVGFRSLPHFSRCFTQKFGMNPTQVRNSSGKATG
ncbi:MAG: helix-turn-helix domain-containing protein [Fimbriimonadaceae bacterium]